MQLREVIKEIRRRKTWTQAQMAAQLGVSQQNIQGMENAGSNLEKQFAIFLKIIPVCRELGIDPARDLNIKPLAGGLLDAAMDKAVNGINPSPKRSGKK